MSGPRVLLQGPERLTHCINTLWKARYEVRPGVLDTASGLLHQNPKNPV